MPNIPITDEAHWLSLRDAHVGGSEVAALFYEWRYPDGSIGVHHVYEQPSDKSAELISNVSSFKTGYRLWQEKVGRVKPDDLSTNDRVQAGIYLEPAIAAWAKEKWNWKIQKVHRYVEHDKVPFWGASLDYEVVEKGKSPVDIKAVDGFIFRERWAVEDGEIVLPPLPYMLQIQHQIGAVNAKGGWLLACVGGNELYRGWMDRHEPTQAKIADAINAFERGVKESVEPDWLADYETVAEMHRDHAIKYGEKDPGVDLTKHKTLAADIEEYLAIKEKMDDWKARADIAKGRVVLALGENTKGRAKGYRLSWPIIVREEKMIPAKLQPAASWRGGLTIREAKE
jgi:putative phage-type endonuclease